MARMTKQYLATCEEFDVVVRIIGGKWKLLILRQLVFDGIKRFGVLRREMHGITQAMLTKQLRALEADGLVTRTAYPEVPPRVEYSATEAAADLKPFFRALRAWALRNLDADDPHRVITMVGGRWKLTILRQLIFGGTKRFTVIKRDTTGITQATLTKQLRALEADGLITRTVYAEVPPRVEYSATDSAMDLAQFFKKMYLWAEKTPGIFGSNNRKRTPKDTKTRNASYLRNRA